MVAEVERKSVVVARPVYEQLLKLFPTSVPFALFLKAFLEINSPKHIV
jgi:hypothetical protein